MKYRNSEIPYSYLQDTILFFTRYTTCSYDTISQLGDAI